MCESNNIQMASKEFCKRLVANQKKHSKRTPNFWSGRDMMIDIIRFTRAC
jgi:hypothetical protein